MVVQHNMQAANASRMLNITAGQQAKSTEKLSSGYRINRAADDAAGLSISEKMRKQIRGLDQASTNAQDGVSAVQTAEGALTEVHSMLQRMNELSVQASNGTNSKTDRDAIQSEIEQLTTEIDRVAETTKFNETYLLKGDDNAATKEVYMKAHDAGLKGALTDGETTGTFKVAAGALDAGKSVTIGGKNYTIGATLDETKKLAADQKTVNKAKVTVNGVEYTSDGTNLKDAGGTTLDTDQIKAGDTVSYNGTTLTAMKDVDGDGIDDSDSSVISATHAVDLMKAELTAANNIGATKTAATVTAGTYAKDTGIEFTITKGKADAAQQLSFNLHVGSDADMTNKINVNIETMNSAYLGIQGLNVSDDSGKAATYAIDAISDALQKVSDQRSSLGAIQNRLEHTIDNLDNVVENTTSAESRIRDTDMADEMVKYSKNNILQQAGQSMLAQANQSTQGVLSLLQ